jgi:hypothetical protein
MFTNELIHELITCPKRVTQGIRTIPSRGGYTKKEFKMESVNGLYQFKGFLNQNASFQEDFSLGLIYYRKEDGGRYCLLRCNGIHGGNKQIPHHNVTHEHTVNPDDLNAGIKDEKIITETDGYTTFEQGIQYYVRKINIVDEDREKYFPRPRILVPDLFGGFS